MRNRIIHITESLARGGAETLLVGVIQSLTQYEHIVISLRDRNDFAGELDGVKVFYFDLKGYRSIPGLVGKVKKLVRPYTENAIIHAHMFWANIISRMAVPRNMPLINSYHSVSYGPQGANYPLHAILLDKFTYSKRLTTVCVSSAVRENVERYIGIRKKIQVLYNYINDSFYQNKKDIYNPGNSLRLVSVGNLKLQKNYATTLEALGMLNKKGRPAICSLDIYGNGPLQESLKKRAKELGIDNVCFKGSLPDIAIRLKGYDAYLLSSSYEGFGIAVAEAMASGLPVIVSDLPVLREVTGGNALFFNPENTGELASCIESIFDGQIDLVSLSSAGKQKAEMYRKNYYMESLAQIYKGVS